MLKFDEDQKAVLLKATQDLVFVAQQLHWIKKDSLSEGMDTALPSLIESHFVSIRKALNYERHLLKEHEQRYVEIREANRRIHELEEQLASSKPIDGLQQQLRSLRDTIYNWWQERGFVHISEISFSGWGVAVVRFFGCQQQSSFE